MGSERVEVSTPQCVVYVLSAGWKAFSSGRWMPHLPALRGLRHRQVRCQRFGVSSPATPALQCPQPCHRPRRTPGLLYPAPYPWAAVPRAVTPGLLYSVPYPLGCCTYSVPYPLGYCAAEQRENVCQIYQMSDQTDQSLAGLIRVLTGLIRSLTGLIRYLTGLIRCLTGLVRL